ncbi:MAG: phage holin family protein [Myxococcota bacterium]
MAREREPRKAAWQRETRLDERHMLPPAREDDSSLAHLHMGELLSLATEKATLLARKEMELARAELEHDLRQEAKTAAGMGAGGVAGLLTVTLLLVAVVFGLTEAGLPGWAASLIVAAVTLAAGSIAALVGWRMRVRRPMAATRRSIQQGVSWAKNLR